MAYRIIQPAKNADIVTPYGITPGSAEIVITFPEQDGVVSLGPSIIASGIITMSALTAGSGSGSVSVTGLTATDVVITSIDTDASGSSFFYTKVEPAADRISFRGIAVTGSTYANCHYVVYRNI